MRWTPRDRPEPTCKRADSGGPGFLLYRYPGVGMGHIEETDAQEDWLSLATADPAF
jgi:hypothetical protein